MNDRRQPVFRQDRRLVVGNIPVRLQREVRVPSENVSRGLLKEIFINNTHTVSVELVLSSDNDGGNEQEEVFSFSSAIIFVRKVLMMFKSSK